MRALIVLQLLFLFPCTSLAAWNEKPTTVVRFGFGEGQDALPDPLDSPPPEIFADEQSIIVIYVWYKPSILVVSKEGKTVQRFSVGDKNRRATKVFGTYESKVVILSVSYENSADDYGVVQIYNYNGKLLTEFTRKSAAALAFPFDINKHGIFMYDQKLGSHWHYNFDGKLISQSKLKPLLIGRRKGKKIIFEDFKIKLRKRMGPVVRDKFGSVYTLVDGRKIIKYDIRGNVVAKIADKQRTIMSSNGEVLEAYGDLVLSGDGNVFQWKRTKDTYEVLRYEWKQ